MLVECCMEHSLRPHVDTNGFILAVWAGFNDVTASSWFQSETIRVLSIPDHLGLPEICFRGGLSFLPEIRVCSDIRGACLLYITLLLNQRRTIRVWPDDLNIRTLPEYSEGISTYQNDCESFRVTFAYIQTDIQTSARILPRRHLTGKMKHCTYTRRLTHIIGVQGNGRKTQLCKANVSSSGTSATGVLNEASLR